MNSFKTPLIIALLSLFILDGLQAQMMQARKFDFSELEGKTLLLPQYDLMKSTAERLKKKGKLEELAESQSAVEQLNENWKKAMAESSYDATDYKLGYDSQLLRKLKKEKNEEYLVLDFYFDDYGNAYAFIQSYGPKYKRIAYAIVTGMDLYDKNDLRLIINMLNESLLTAAELYDEEGKVNKKGQNIKYKEDYVKFYEGIEDKTFLVVKSNHENEKKRERRNEDLKEAISGWKLCNYEFIDEEELNLRRLEGDPESFYWRSIPVYVSAKVPIPYYYNILLSTDSDNVLVSFLGKGRMKPATISKIENKIVTKGENFKKSL